MQYSDFITDFPEFSVRSQPLVERTLAQTTIECDGFEGITGVEDRELAIGLLVAHTIKLELRDENPMENGVISEIKSRNDTVKFATGDASGYNLDSTQYGVRLQKLLNSRYPFG